MSYSELKVMQSAAGYYIGREFTDPETGFIEPGSRESGYYPSTEQASSELINKNWEVRECMENEFMYEQNPDLNPPQQ